MKGTVIPMYVTARSRLILEKMLMTKHLVLLSDLASDFEVSERTIRRDFKEIKALLKSFDLGLEKAGAYYGIHGSEDKLAAFKWQLLDLTYNEYTPDERQHYILKELLKSDDSLKLIALANDLNVTVATVSNDLSKIEEDYLLTEQITRKPGLGISLNVDEKVKRRLMSQLFWEKIPRNQFIQLYNQKDVDELSEERLSYLFEQIGIETIEDSLEDIRQALSYDMSDDAYFNLVIHITITVDRIRSGQTLALPEDIADLREHEEFALTRGLLASLLSLPPLEVPESEIAFVTTHLRGAKHLTDSGTFSENEQIQAVTLASQLINYVSEQTDRDLNSEMLLKGLTAHLRPTLRRLTNQLSINNPLLGSIQRDYPKLFKIVREGFDSIYRDIPVPDEEIGYLVLHFGAAILQDDQQVQLSALVVCASGIGTSKMLVTRLRKAIPQLKQLKTISLFELERTLEQQPFDVVVSTIDLGEVPYRYIHVSPILTEREISQIEVYLQSKGSTYGRKNRQENQQTNLSKREAVHLLETKHSAIETVISLIDSFEVIPITETKLSPNSIIRAMCTNLLSHQPALDIEALVKALTIREEWSGFGITNTKIALFHARTAEIKAPVFQLFPLKNEVQIPGMDGSQVMVNTLVLLLAPEKLDSRGLEVMSQISSLLIEDPETIALIQSGKISEISDFVIQRLVSFIDN